VGKSLALEGIIRCLRRTQANSSTSIDQLRENRENGRVRQDEKKKKGWRGRTSKRGAGTQEGKVKGSGRRIIGRARGRARGQGCVLAWNGSGHKLVARPASRQLAPFSHTTDGGTAFLLWGLPILLQLPLSLLLDTATQPLTALTVFTVRYADLYLARSPVHHHVK